MKWSNPLLIRSIYICPMIDARRMEVFCNLRDVSGAHIWKSKPLILEETTFDEFGDQSHSSHRRWSSQVSRAFRS